MQILSSANYLRITSTNKGKNSELLAKNFLLSRGFKILGQNIKFGRKELDLMAEKDGILHLIEVKASFYGIKELFNRNIKNYITQESLEEKYKDISLDLIVAYKEKVNFYENISSEFLI